MSFVDIDNDAGITPSREIAHLARKLYELQRNCLRQILTVLVVVQLLLCNDGTSRGRTIEGVSLLDETERTESGLPL